MMEEKETTRNRIVDAVFANMEEKPIDRVTVKDVCKIANVSKSTFYRYYDSVDDVVKAFQEQIFVRLNSINELYNLTTLSQADTGPTPSVVRVLEILRENDRYVLALNGPNGDPSFKERIDRMLWDSFSVRLRNHKDRFSDFGIYLSFAIVGHDAAIEYWLRECPEVSPADFCLDLMRLLNGVFYLPMNTR